ncbi:hypothetical protein APICC_01403 [Apis cerana cerana]|uniref:Uncharacterized protein n=1 Tax=Apis cerana cerana TaxID=94128 RepID=A0A2A3E3G8_APICC|nr:hypothetical protein APICC_01403 [Apis cerana cerana]
MKLTKLALAQDREYNNSSYFAIEPFYLNYNDLASPVSVLSLVSNLLTKTVNRHNEWKQERYSPSSSVHTLEIKLLLAP